MDTCANVEKGKSMKEASEKESFVVWEVEVGNKRIRKRSPKGLHREIKHRIPLEVDFQCTMPSACDSSSAPIVKARVRMVVRASCCSS